MAEKNVCLIVAHDAGGAEILASYVKQNKQQVFLFVLAGPAVKVLQRQLGSIVLVTLDQGLLDATWCLCGTSWQSDIEWHAINKARLLGKRVVVFIDHWVNYSERFIRNGIQHLPDEIWVGDAYAERIANETFLQTPVKIVENPYLIDVKQEMYELRQSITERNKHEKSILFVSENISGHALLKYGDREYFGYTEFDAINFLLKNLDQIDKTIKTMVIRPHPSDQPGKYDDFLKQYPDLIKMSKESSTLLRDIIEADTVAGCQSMALVVGVLAKKKVISCMPGAHQCQLPHKEILNLKDLAVD